MEVYSMKTLKDVDFVYLKEKNFITVKLSNKVKLEILQILMRDSKFLCDTGIMDYSLLFGIEKVT